jgi:hypothetical protein
MMSRDSNSYQSDKDIATQKPNNNVEPSGDVAAKASTDKLCNCHDSKPGIISSELSDHEIGCHIRKRILTGRYAIKTSVIPHRIRDGCSLGVAPGGEDF